MDPPQQRDRALARGAARAAAVAQDGLDDLVADGEARIERGHRLLEDHRHAVAAEIAQRLVIGRQQIEPVEADGAGHLSGSLRQQSHDRKRGDALAAAGFADEAEGGAVGDGEVDAIDGVGGAAVIAMKQHAQIPDVDERTGHQLSLAVAAAIDASMVARSVIPAGFCRVGRNLRKCTQRSLLTRSSRVELGEWIGMIVDAQIERGPFLAAIDQQRRRLLAALVAAGSLARAHRRDQALREGQCCVLDISLRRLVQNLRARQHVAGDGEAVACNVAAPVDALLAGMRGDAALYIHDVQLPAFAALIGRKQRRDNLLRALAVLQQPDAIDAVIGIDQRLRRDTAETGRDVRHPRADREEFGRDRDPELGWRRLSR